MGRLAKQKDGVVRRIKLPQQRRPKSDASIKNRAAPLVLLRKSLSTFSQCLHSTRMETNCQQLF